MMSYVHHSERGSVISDCLVTGSVMTSQVHHSERGSVISDCLVTGSVMTSQVHHSERGSVISEYLVVDVFGCFVMRYFGADRLTSNVWWSALQAYQSLMDQ